MSVRLFIKATPPGPHIPADKLHMAWQKGQIVDARVASDGYGTQEGLPNFVHVVIPNIQLSQVQNYLEGWAYRLEMQVVSSDLSTDDWRIRL